MLGVTGGQDTGVGGLTMLLGRGAERRGCRRLQELWGGARPQNQAPPSVLCRHGETSEAGGSVRMQAVSAQISHVHPVPSQSPVRPAGAQLGVPRSGADDSSRRQPCSWPGTALGLCLSPGGSSLTTAKAGVGVVTELHSADAETQASRLGDPLKSCSSHLQCALGFGGPCAQALLCVCFTPL